MFPPPSSSESMLSDGMNPLTRAYHDVVIYGDADADDALYEGPVVVHANGWLELEGHRLLSPCAVHHVDVYDDNPGDRGDDGRRHDDDRTGRFSPR